MPIPNPSRLNTLERSTQFWEMIKKLQDQLELNDSVICKMMGMDLSTFETSRSESSSPHLNDTILLADQLGLSLSHFLHRAIDYKVLKNNFTKKPPILTEKYMSNAFGNMKSFRAMMQYLAITRPALQRLVLAELQIDPRSLANPKIAVNIQMYEDATDKMAKLGLTLDDFRAMGTLTARENLQTTPLSMYQLHGNQSNSKVLEASLLKIQEFADKNHDYQIEKVTSTHALFSSKPTQKIQEITKRKLVGNHYTSIIKESMFNEIPPLLVPDFQIKTDLIKCIHQGDNRCLYLLKVC